MERYIYDQNNRLWYELQGDYYIPCLVLGETNNTPPIGMWGRKRLSYLKEHRPVLYSTLVLNGTLHRHLAEVDNRANEMLNRLVMQMAEQQGITKQLKTQDQMEWVQRMNNIRNSAEEIILHEVIYEEGAV